MGGVCCGDGKSSSRGKGDQVNVTKINTNEQGRASTNGEIMDTHQQAELFNQRRLTNAPNMKNFKNLKQVKNIHEVYKFEDVIGKGSFGQVRKAIRTGSNNAVAVKIIEKESLNANPMLP